MSAEIIHFGRGKAIENVSVQLQRVKIENVQCMKEAVRCAVDGRLYDVEFSGKDMVRVYTVCHRGQNDRIQEVRYHQWSASGYCPCDLDPAVVTVARAARGKPAVVREAVIEQLRQRHAKLLRDAAKVETMIATIQRGGAIRAPTQAV
jgi:hypothetical protein